MSEYLIKSARKLATKAHAGQVDKAGRPYIEHVARVAEAVRGDDAAEAVAWLHDVLEDHPGFTEQVSGFPAHIVRACYHLDRSWASSDDEYYSEIRKCALALKVKLADIADNADESRLAMLDESTANRLRAKYTKARAALATFAEGAETSDERRE